MLIKNMC